MIFGVSHFVDRVQFASVNEPAIAAKTRNVCFGHQVTIFAHLNGTPCRERSAFRARCRRWADGQGAAFEPDGLVAGKGRRVMSKDD
jgi:hypothetical protein